MANYVAHYTKKKQILRRKELALGRLINRGATLDQLTDAAENVREARVRVLRARRATIAPKDDADAAFATIDNNIQAILDTSPQAILAEFGCSLPDADDQRRA